MDNQSKTSDPITAFLAERERRNASKELYIAQLVAEAHAKKEYRPVAVAVIIRSDSKVLLVASAKNLSNWGFPQGGIDEGEDARTALFREMNEELGITPDQVTIRRFIAHNAHDAPFPRQGERGFAKGKHYFLFEVFYNGPDELSINEDEIGLYSWADELEAEMLIEGTIGAQRLLVSTVVPIVRKMHKLLRMLEGKNSA